MATIEKRTTDKGIAYRVKVRLRGFPPETATFERLTERGSGERKSKPT